MDLKDSFGAVWRRRLLVAALMVVGVVTVGAVGLPGERQARFTASVTLGVTGGTAPEQVLLYEQIAEDTAEIRERVVGALGEDLFGDRSAEAVLTETVGVDADEQIGLLVVTVVDVESSAGARSVIDAYAANLLAYSGEERIEERDRQLEAATVRASELEARIEELAGELEVLAAGQTEDERAAGLEVDTVRQAEYDVAREQYRALTSEIEELANQSDEELMALRRISEPTVVDTSTADPLGAGGRLVAAAGLSALLGIGLAAGLGRLDDRVYRRREVEEAYRLPVLAQVPRLGRPVRRGHPLIVASLPGDPASEAFRVLRSELERSRRRQEVLLGGDVDGGGAGTVVLVVSGAGGVGRTTTAANLAAAAAAAGKRVLVVGGDLRGREVGRLFGVAADHPGLSDAAVAVVAGRRVALADQVVAATVAGIDVLPTGSVRGNPGETLAAARFLFDEAREAYDLVVVDTPPMLAGGDVNELVPVADLVVVVARAGSSTGDEGRWVEEMASRLQAPTCGVVLIGAGPELARSGVAGRLRGRSRRSRPVAVAPRSLAELASELVGSGSVADRDRAIAPAAAPVAGVPVAEVATTAVAVAEIPEAEVATTAVAVAEPVTVSDQQVVVVGDQAVEGEVVVEPGGGSRGRGGGSGSVALVRVGSGRSAGPASLIDV